MIALDRYYGPDGPPDILVAYGSSRDGNPSIPQEDIDRELERDPVANRAEYLSIWRDDVAGFIRRECAEACIGDYIELPPEPGIVYVCFIDTASGVPDGDSYVAVIAHRHKQDKSHVIIDAIREVRPPFSALEVINTVLVPLCKAYRIYKVWGDNFAGDLAKDPIRRAGIGYELSPKHKTELYADPFLALLNATKITLPRHERAINQICSLERSVQRTGREQITHPIHGHDDIANAIAGAVDRVYGNPTYTLEPFSPGYVDPDARQRSTQPAPPVVKRVHPFRWFDGVPRSEEKIPGVSGTLMDLARKIDREGGLP